jgi:hypothetical protein
LRFVEFKNRMTRPLVASDARILDGATALEYHREASSVQRRYLREVAKGKLRSANRVGVRLSCTPCSSAGEG